MDTRLKFSDTVIYKARLVDLTKKQTDTWTIQGSTQPHTVQLLPLEDSSGISQVEATVCDCTHGKHSGGYAKCYHVAAALLSCGFTEDQLLEGITVGFPWQDISVQTT